MSGQKFISVSELEKLSDSNQTSCSKDGKSAACVLSCCQSCLYCSFTRASTKERSKPRQLSEQNKACQSCMLCKSMCFCPNCVQCPQCCRRTECRWQALTVLAYLARNGCESSGGICPKGWLHTSLQKQAPFNKDPFDSKRLCKSNQKHVPKRRPGQSHAQVGSRKGCCQVLPGLLQPTFSSSQTQQEMEANLRFKSAQLVPQYRYLQNGNSGDDPVVLEYRGGGHVARLQRRLLPHPNCTKVKKVSQVLPVPTDFPVHSPAIRTGNSSPGVYQGGKRSETYGSSEGYQDPPVPRRLVTESPFPGNLPTTYPDPLGPMSAVILGSIYDQIRVSSQTGLQFRRLLVLPTQDRWKTLQEKLRFIKGHHQCTVRQFMSLIGLLTATEKQVCTGRLHMRPIQWHLKKNWHVPEVVEKVIPVPQSLHPHLDWWLDEANVLKGQPLHPLQHAVQLFTDASNEGWGTHLGDFTARGAWSPLESPLHINFLELKAVLLALRQFEHLFKDQIVLVTTDNTTVSYINKQGGMRSGSLCALLWRLLSWCHPRGIILSARHIPGRLM